MKRGAFVIVLLGLALAVYIIFRVGFADVGHALAAAGWGGLAFLSLFWLALFVALGSAWYLLAPPPRRPGLWVYAWGRIVRDSATELLPFSQLGGFVAGARAVILNGVSTPFAFASTVVDLTAEMMSQIAFTVIGLILLATRVSHVSFANPWVIGSILGVIGAIGAAAAFVVLQIRGGAMVQKLIAHILPKAVPQADAVNTDILALYAKPMRLAVSSAVHLICWLLGVVGVWVLLKMIMGIRIDFLDVMGVESLLAVVSSVFSFIPLRAGVQEGAYVFIGQTFGLGHDAALALSLLKRGRDVVIGVPALLIWQAIEGRRLFAKAGAGKGVSGE